MSKLLKKVTASNPLANFHLWDELKEYELIITDEELANFYHKILTRFEDRPLVCRFILAMISFSVGGNINTKIDNILEHDS